MNRQRLVLILVIIAVVLISGLYLFSEWFSKTTGYFLGEDEKTKFIMCLNERKTVLYTADNCIECYRQEQLLGEKSTLQLDVFNCQEDECKNLRSLPAWEIDGNIYYGKRNFNDLEQISGCAFQ